MQVGLLTGFTMVIHVQVQVQVQIFLFKEKHNTYKIHNGDWNPRGFICPVIYVQFTLHNKLLFCDNTG